MNPTLLLWCGSLRAGSVNEAVLNTAERLVSERIQTQLYPHLALLPAFNPDHDQEPLHPVVIDLRHRIRTATAILICTPEYAGALPGTFKNLLDWTVGGGEMDSKPVAWINTAGPAAPNGGEGAHASLRTVLGYLGATVIESACIRLSVTRQSIGSDGLLADESLRRAVRGAVQSLMKL